MQGWVGYYLNVLSISLDKKCPQHPWLKIKTSLLCQMEATQWEQQTKYRLCSRLEFLTKWDPSRCLLLQVKYPEKKQQQQHQTNNNKKHK